MQAGPVDLEAIVIGLGLLPYRGGAAEGSGAWEAWADKVMEFVVLRGRVSEAERRLLAAEANTAAGWQVEGYSPRITRLAAEAAASLRRAGL